MWYCRLRGSSSARTVGMACPAPTETWKNRGEMRGFSVAISDSGLFFKSWVKMNVWGSLSLMFSSYLQTPTFPLAKFFKMNSSNMLFVIFILNVIKEMWQTSAINRIWVTRPEIFSYTVINPKLWNWHFASTQPSPRSKALT